MIHTIDTLTIRRYGEIDRTGNLSLLKRWWNVFPVGWFDVQKLIIKIGQGLNTGIDKQLVIENERLRAYNNILILEGLYMAVYNLIVYKPENDQWNVTKNKPTHLGYYLETVYLRTGIRIKDLLGLGKLKKEIQRLTDKYTERFNQKKAKDKNIPFIQYAYSIFSFMEMPYNGDTKMSEFFELVRLAEEKVRKLDKLKEKHG